MKHLFRVIVLALFASLSISFSQEATSCSVTTFINGTSVCCDGERCSSRAGKWVKCDGEKKTSGCGEAIE